MTDNDVEGKPVEGGGAVAKPEPSPEPAQPNADLSALMARIDKLEHENRSLQSGKDKRFNEIMPVINQVADILGLDPKKVAEAQETAIIREIVAERKAGLNQPASSVGNEVKPIETQSEVQTLLQKYQLSSADTDVTLKLKEATERGWSNDRIRAEFADLALSRTNKPTPSQSVAPPVSGGSSSTFEDLDKVREEFETLSQKDPFGARAKELRKKILAKGGTI